MVIYMIDLIANVKLSQSVASKCEKARKKSKELEKKKQQEELEEKKME